VTMAGETPTIVLVHGAWADATGFDAEIRALQRRGFRAIGFANPLRDLAGDAAYLAEFLRSLTRPIVLVGHSYGGNVSPTPPWRMRQAGSGPLEVRGFR
jgi:pimeloyl-ACP methyl ester carboxylesterase